MSAMQKRNDVVALVSSAENYVKTLDEAHPENLDRHVLRTQHNIVSAMRIKFCTIQEEIIKNEPSDVTKDAEVVNKTLFLKKCDAILTKLSTLMNSMPVDPNELPDPTPGPSTSTSETAEFCKVMQQFMRQSQAQMHDLMEILITQASTNQTHNVNPSMVRLPQIDLPKFDGRYADWVSFKDRFKSTVIDHPNLTSVQKLDYLKSSLSGDASSTIRHLSTTEANFEVAWRLLVERFERNSEIVSEHVRTFFSIPHVSQSEPSTAIRTIANTLSETVMALDALNVTQRDPWIIQYALDKLDTESRVLWGRENGNEMPTLEKFKKFLHQRCIDALNATDVTPKPSQNLRQPVAKPNPSSASGFKRPISQTNAFPATSDNVACKCCHEVGHPLYRCQKFLDLTSNQRYETVRELNLCRNCLASHLTNSCSFHKCRRCQGKHNILLHEYFAQIPPQTDPVPTDSPTPTVEADSTPSAHLNTLVASATSRNTSSRVYLATAVINILAADGSKVSCRVLLDSGAQVCLMTSRLAQQLGLPTAPSDTRVYGVGKNAAQSTHQVSATIESRLSGESFNVNCLILPQISGNIPNWTTDHKAIRIPVGVKMADPRWAEQSPVDMLICGDVYWSTVLNHRISLGTGLPHLRETKFGYALVGEHQSNSSDVRHVHLSQGDHPQPSSHTKDLSGNGLPHPGSVAPNSSPPLPCQSDLWLKDHCVDISQPPGMAQSNSSEENAKESGHCAALSPVKKKKKPPYRVSVEIPGSVKPSGDCKTPTAPGLRCYSKGSPGKSGERRPTSFGASTSSSNLGE
ncbi:uncharacterized protein LOC129786565 [Lutzomyia longipalpis]|uniref:uncharacterized protein LOC129786565 n=1 Tax=Lutzomyia longipalpis TaxID=7200 RepID=UPI002483F2D2|nr:uncharacterized protein LOC129786565 [Lutzomyia longipalpis]